MSINVPHLNTREFTLANNPVVGALLECTSSGKCKFTTQISDIIDITSIGGLEVGMVAKNNSGNIITNDLVDQVGSVAVRGDRVSASSTSIGTQTECTGTDSVCIGYSSVCSGTNALVMGSSASGLADECIVVGSGAEGSGQSCVVFGQNASAEGAGSIVLGNSSTSQGDNSIVIGANSTDYGLDGCVVVGNSLTAAAAGGFYAQTRDGSDNTDTFALFSSNNEVIGGRYQTLQLSSLLAASGSLTFPIPPPGFNLGSPNFSYQRIGNIVMATIKVPYTDDGSQVGQPATMQFTPQINYRSTFGGFVSGIVNCKSTQPIVAAQFGASGSNILITIWRASTVTNVGAGDELRFVMMYLISS